MCTLSFIALTQGKVLIRAIALHLANAITLWILVNSIRIYIERSQLCL
jgi:hypothetical protein